MNKEVAVAIGRLLLRAARFPILVFSVHCVLSLAFNAYDRCVWLDLLMHFAGGLAIANFFDHVLSLLDDASIVEIRSRTARLLMIFGLVAFAAIAWELAEFLADFFFQAGAQRSIANVMKDQLLGVLGGAAYAAMSPRETADD